MTKPYVKYAMGVMAIGVLFALLYSIFILGHSHSRSCEKVVDHILKLHDNHFNSSSNDEIRTRAVEACRNDPLSDYKYDCVMRVNTYEAMLGCPGDRN